jgi:hypothetical protein
MDDSRFDSLTKELSRLRSRRLARRGALRALAGALFGGVVAAHPVGQRASSVLAQCFADGELCGGNEECCSGFCDIQPPDASGTCGSAGPDPVPTFPTDVFAPVPDEDKKKKKKKDKEEEEKKKKKKKKKDDDDEKKRKKTYPDYCRVISNFWREQQWHECIGAPFGGVG